MDNREYAYIFDYTCSGIYEAELNDETRDLDTEAFKKLVCILREDVNIAMV